MRFSLVVSTIGRVDDLRALLASLTVQTFRDFEVIVVDQNSVDQNSDDRLSELVREFKPMLTLHHIPMPQRGVSRGRNRGMREASGDIVTFPDDDCTYRHDLLERVDAMFAKLHDMDALSVRCDTPLGGVQKIARFDAAPGPVTRKNLLHCFVEFAFFARRDQFDGLSFNESLGVGAGTPWGSDEGPDLVLRMLSRGCRMRYCPEISILHASPLESIDEQTLRRSYTYGCGRGRLYRLHRFPPHAVLYSLVRSLGGCCLNLAQLRRIWARYYWLAFCGKVRGYLASI
jgi:glycosyltransferase involved in cell wall biosynthesis